MNLNKEQQDFIKKDALQDISKECCGVIYEDGEICSCPNKSSTPNFHFLIDNRDLKDKKIIAYYHSHINDSPIGMFDKYTAEKFNLECIVFKTKSQTFDFYKPVGLEIPYEGREFYVGIFDCVTLIQDYYQRQYNITLNDFFEFIYQKTKLTAEDVINITNLLSTDIKNLNLIKEYNVKQNDGLKRFFEENGFFKVKNLQKGDVIILKSDIFKFPLHCLLYMGNDKVLHQPSDGLSLIELYNQNFKNRTIHIMRHKHHE